jgi:hypothetical protein
LVAIGEGHQRKRLTYRYTQRARTSKQQHPRSPPSTLRAGATPAPSYGRPCPLVGAIETTLSFVALRQVVASLGLSLAERSTPPKRSPCSDRGSAAVWRARASPAAHTPIAQSSKMELSTEKNTSGLLRASTSHAADPHTRQPNSESALGGFRAPCPSAAFYGVGWLWRPDSFGLGEELSDLKPSA